MYTKKFLLILSILVLVSISCSLTVNLPVTTDIKTGPTVEEEILIAFDDLVEELKREGRIAGRDVADIFGAHIGIHLSRKVRLDDRSARSAVGP